jgi:hypothetical protein
VSEQVPDPVNVQTAFFVVVGLDGVISVHTDKIPAVTMSREATLYDIETYASQLVRNVSRLMTSHTVAQLVTPAEAPSVSDRVSDALKRRDEE